VLLPTGGSSGLVLPGASTLTLGQNDSVTLMYSTNATAWVTIAASNN
jgi:hypothetical protein